MTGRMDGKIHEKEPRRPLIYVIIRVLNWGEWPKKTPLTYSPPHKLLTFLHIQHTNRAWQTPPNIEERTLPQCDLVSLITTLINIYLGGLG
jgi:hypothetical protein